MTEQMVDRPLRSVFVGNIPYEVTEEKLKEIFSEVGPVLSLKLVYDRETGKPKGYGFCEYKDIETAMSAMRNLNGYEINGRVLRVDNAGAERHRMAEVSGAGSGGGGGGGSGGGMGMGQHQHNGPRHDNEGFVNFRDEGPPAPEKAPEVISKAVASLPPEQMFEIMKQMKLCIQNNPAEARTMLLQNPQLAYALLQALVVMKIVDPPTAISMLHKDNGIGMGSLLPEGQMNMMAGTGPGGPGGFSGGAPPPTENPWIAAAAGGATGVPLMPPNPPGPFGPGPGNGPPGPGQGNVPGGDMDLRPLDPRLRSQGGGPQDFDLRDPRSQPDRFQMERRDRDLRDMRDRDMRGDRDLRSDRDLRDPRTDRDMRDRDMRDLRAPLDPRAARRGASGPSGSDSAAAAANAAATSAASKAAAAAFSGMAGLGPGATDKEKANLIMQVLQLSDEQINLLPVEQRQSILVLKEQIAKTSQGR